MSEMVERVAAALKAHYEAGDPDRIWADSRDGNMEPLVRFVIAAMREPTQDMRHCIWDCLEKNASVGNCKPGMIRGNGVPDVFLGIIVDEALKP